MVDFRVVATDLRTVSDRWRFTYQKDDRTAEGVWHRPNTPILIFADHSLDGVSVTHHGGPIAGAPGGHPLQLVFWGDWWLNAGAPLREQLEGWTRAMLDSPYFTQLAQYGVPNAPVWRGSTIVSDPAPPMQADNVLEISEQVVELIDTLIDDDVFPDPDDGPRILFVVVLPDGFVLTDNADGAHWLDYDFDFPFDTDTFWAGWVRPMPDRETMMRVISHEVVEMLTDPERDAWRTERNTATNEISDAGFSPGAAQSAFVNGARVQSYWSNAHGATIIPIDTDYAARLSARVRETGRRPLTRGTFRIEPNDRAACPEVPECCIEDREYDWRVDGLDERARVTLNWRRFAQPVTKWSINGVALGASPVTINLPVEEFTGRTTKVVNRAITLRFANPPGRTDILDIFADNPGGNFEISVGCMVTDGSITGNVAANVIATPVVTVGFNCAEMLLEDAYIDQKSACLTAMLKRYVKNYKPLGRIRPEEGINWDPSELLRDRPAYFLPSHYERLRWLGKVGRAAHALLDHEEAVRFTQMLSVEAPVLARTMPSLNGRLRDVEKVREQPNASSRAPSRAKKRRRPKPS